MTFNNIFSDEFSTARSNFSESKMNLFLENHIEEFSKLADKHIYQINHFKETEQNG